MKINNLRVTSKPSRRRVGRGIAAGQGKTAGRGTKGQKARTGKTARYGFEGGQQPLMQRVPKKRGFRPFWESSLTIPLKRLNALKGTVDNQKLYEARITDSPYSKVRVVSSQDFNAKLTVRLQGASTQAIQAIEQAGGSFEVIPQLARPSKQSMPSSDKK